MKANDLVTEIAATITAMLDAGTRPWIKPWDASKTSSLPDEPLRSNGERFKGMNYFWLSLVGASTGCYSPYWMTYKQAQELGGQVKKGAKATRALLGSTSTTKSTDPTTLEETSKTSTFFKAYPVFNADQIDNLPPNYYPVFTSPTDEQINATNEQARALNSFDIARRVGPIACYRHGPDDVTMPLANSFLTEYDFLATLAHELAHATGAPHRTGRHARIMAKVGLPDSIPYRNMEELVAELASIMICTRLQIPPSQTHMDNHASYLASWSRAISDKPGTIIKAASMAQEAADYVLAKICQKDVNQTEKIAA